MEESISRLAGSYHGTKLDPDQLVAAAHAAGRPAAERTTLYEIRRSYPLTSPPATGELDTRNSSMVVSI
jgi:FO synthase